MTRMTLTIAAGICLLTTLCPAQVQESPEKAKQQEQEIAAHVAELRQKQHKLDAEANALSAKFSGVLTSTQAVQQAALELEQRAQEAQFEQAMVRARRVATEKQIAMLAAKVEAALKADELLKALQDHLKITASDIQKLADAGRMPASEARDSTIRLRLQVAQRQAEVAAQAGAEVIQRFNADLIAMEIQEAEFEAKERFLAERHAQMRQNLEIVKQIEQSKHQARQLEFEARSLEQGDIFALDRFEQQREQRAKEKENDARSPEQEDIDSRRLIQQLNEKRAKEIEADKLQQDRMRREQRAKEKAKTAKE